MEFAITLLVSMVGVVAAWQSYGAPYYQQYQPYQQYPQVPQYPPAGQYPYGVYTNNKQNPWYCHVNPMAPGCGGGTGAAGGQGGTGGQSGSGEGDAQCVKPLAGFVFECPHPSYDLQWPEIKGKFVTFTLICPDVNKKLHMTFSINDIRAGANEPDCQEGVRFKARQKDDGIWSDWICGYNQGTAMTKEAEGNIGFVQYHGGSKAPTANSRAAVVSCSCI